jgi:hypothetical protein
MQQGVSDSLGGQRLTMVPVRARTEVYAGGDMPTGPQPEDAARNEDIQRRIPAEVRQARTRIEHWITATFPPARNVAVTIALLEIAIEWQLSITDDHEHLLRRIHSIFADAVQGRREPRVDGRRKSADHRQDRKFDDAHP